MSVCSYLVFPADGAREDVAQCLAAIAGCEVTQAENSDLMVLVTDTPDPAAEESLRASLEAVEGIECLVLAFGGLEPAGPAPEDAPHAPPPAGPHVAD